MMVYINFKIDKKGLKQVLGDLRDIYQSLEDDSMIMVAFSGRADDKCPDRSYSNDWLRGRCFLKIKNEYVEKLDDEIGELFKMVEPNKKGEEIDDESS